MRFPTTHRFSQFNSAASPKIWLGPNIFDFKRATVFGLGHRLSKHKTARYAKHFGGYSSFGPPLATTMFSMQAIMQLTEFSKQCHGINSSAPGCFCLFYGKFYKHCCEIFHFHFEDYALPG